jgi:phosphoglycolate phosphatase
MDRPFALFDLDGTVWDSQPGILACLAHAMQATDSDPLPTEVLVQHIGPPLAAMLAEVGVAPERIDEGVTAYRERYHSHGVYEAVLYPGVTELLDQLKDAGWLLATATSKGVVGTELMIDHFGLRDRFDVVAAASMHETAHHKHDVIARALAGLGRAQADPTQPAGWMIGDRSYDIEGGAAAGLRTVAVTWGYGSEQERRAAPPHEVAESVADLQRILLGPATRA